jgi:diguanylate cyclase
MLGFELTESAITRDEDVTEGTLCASPDGDRRHLDDIGTRYSSLVHLNRLRVSCVKICARILGARRWALPPAGPLGAG